MQTGKSIFFFWAWRLGKSSPVALTAGCFQPGLDLRLRGVVGCHCWAKEQCHTDSWVAQGYLKSLCLPYFMHLKYIFYFRMRSPQVDSYCRWANVCCLFKLGCCEMFHLKSSEFFSAWSFCMLPCRNLQYGITSLLFFFKLVLAAGGKGMILNGLVYYKWHKEAPSSTSCPAVIISRGLEVSGMTKNYNSTYQWLTLGFFQRWFLSFQLIFF